MVDEEGLAYIFQMTWIEINVSDMDNDMEMIDNLPSNSATASLSCSLSTIIWLRKASSKSVVGF